MEEGSSSVKKKKITRFLIEIYASIFVIASFFSAVIIYSIEDNSLFEFSTIPHAFLWSAKAILGGNAQATPETFSGNFLLVVNSLIGLVLLALAINIIARPIKKYIEKD